MEDVYKKALKVPQRTSSATLFLLFQTPLTITIERGSTLHTTRCNAFQKLLCAHDGVFMRIHKGIQEDFDAMFQPRVNKLVSALDRIFAQIQHDVDQVCSTNEDDSLEAKAIREELLEMLPAAREFLKEKIQKPLKQCEDKGK